MTDFLIDKKDLKNAVVEAAPALSIGDGDVLLRLDFFALTANNITLVYSKPPFSLSSFFFSSSTYRTSAHAALAGEPLFYLILLSVCFSLTIYIDC